MKQVEFAGIEDFPAGLLTSTLRCAADTLSNDTLGEREIDLDQRSVATGLNLIYWKYKTISEFKFRYTCVKRDP